MPDAAALLVCIRNSRQRQAAQRVGADGVDKGSSKPAGGVAESAKNSVPAPVVDQFERGSAASRPQFSLQNVQQALAGVFKTR